MITLFGATGYTGRLIAHALARQGLPLRLAGRSAEKLARLSESLPSRPAWLVADVAQPETLAALFRGTRVVVNCVGPFTDLGERVAAQAALTGVRYLDTTNELGYVYRLRTYEALAHRSGAVLVPACGFEVALADCAAALLGRSLLPSTPGAAPGDGPARLDEISIIYSLSGRGSSLATRRSAIRALATSWIGYAGGQWVGAAPGSQVRRVQLPGGPRAALSFPSSEIVTIPTHVPVRAVMTWMTISPAAYWWAPALVPLFARLAGGPVGALTLALISRIALPPEAGLRSEAGFTLQVEAHRQGQRQALTLTGQGVYDLTAEIVAYAAGKLLEPAYSRAGVLAPAAALDPQAWLDHAQTHWRVSLQRDGEVAEPA
jgi:short subunit dehydrogenase-like uncharacterized protein